MSESKYDVYANNKRIAYGLSYEDAIFVASILAVARGKSSRRFLPKIKRVDKEKVIRIE